MTPEEQRNLSQLKKWADTYNDNVEAMVDEVYAADCVVQSMFTGLKLNGREALRQLEREILAKAPGRRLEVVNAIASGSVVVAECNGIFGGNRFPACVVLTFNAAGQVISDHTYSPDPTGVTTS